MVDDDPVRAFNMHVNGDDAKGVKLTDLGRNASSQAVAKNETQAWGVVLDLPDCKCHQFQLALDVVQ
eukprot:3051419-Pleurochrysis_carterae.AAC.1